MAVFSSLTAAKSEFQFAMLFNCILADYVLEPTDVLCYTGSNECASEVHEPKICLHA